MERDKADMDYRAMLFSPNEVERSLMEVADREKTGDMPLSEMKARLVGCGEEEDVKRRAAILQELISRAEREGFAEGFRRGMEREMQVGLARRKDLERMSALSEGEALDMGYSVTYSIAEEHLKEGSAGLDDGGWVGFLTWIVWFSVFMAQFVLATMSSAMGMLSWAQGDRGWAVWSLLFVAAATVVTAAWWMARGQSYRRKV